MNTLIPAWIIAGPAIALIVLSFSFKGPTAMSDTVERLPPRDTNAGADHSIPMLDPVVPDNPRRIV